jgi:hypothetical protein
MATQLPKNVSNSITFDFESVEYTLSAPRWNPRSLCYSVDLKWGVEEGVLGMFIAGGIDLLANIPSCPLPNLWAFNESNFINDLEQSSLDSLAFVII